MTYILVLALIFRKQNKFQIKKETGIQSHENGRFYWIKIKTWSMYSVKSF